MPSASRAAAYDELSGGQDASHSTFAAIALGTLPFAFLGSLSFLAIEMRQIRLGSLGEHLRDPWNIVQLSAYGLQLFVDVLFVMRGLFPAGVVRSLCAFSLLLLFFNVLFFARGFDNLGPIVTMVLQIVVHIRHYVLVMLVIVCAFAMAFTVALGPRLENYADPIRALFLLINTGVYGELTWVVPDLTTATAMVLFQARACTCPPIPTNDAVRRHPPGVVLRRR